MAAYTTTSDYRGRFAPSPSGPLHAGSLVAAVGSYLDAKANHGVWLVRIEDIDPPREVPGAATTILRQLEAHGLNWDEPVRYQSQQDQLYQENLAALNRAGLLYACACTRKDIKARGPFYTGYCRDRHLPLDQHHAWRFRNLNAVTSLQDQLHGVVELDPNWAAEDFILRRRDGLWAYQLAVVSDDREQRINHIVRGSDLLTPSAWQLTLWQALNSIGSDPVATPQLCHLPLVTDINGRKLSKQNHAPGLDNACAANNLSDALTALGLQPPAEISAAPVAEQLAWATPAWRSHVENFTV